ncbi:MAG TPA: AGE family epimerase/isomerase [Treponemataceae bacterium]|nr:AGE family epimerase/isomerase [Treponemataceae bacterium]
MEATMKFNPEQHLNSVILPYWNSLKDSTGGFYGFVDHNLTVNKKADKGVILNSRILWFYSNVYLSTGDESSLAYADHAYDFLINSCLDKENGGLFWMINSDGTVKDTVKNAYNQAFGIYALSSYYRASGNKDALNVAYSLFECIESYCADEYGYLEAFDKTWKNAVESAICDQGVVADKTMNTLLHVLEAYTELLYSDAHPSVARKLLRILNICKDKMYNPELKRLEVFFDRKMETLSDIHSYGHDIEAAWLLDRACEVLEANSHILSYDENKELYSSAKIIREMDSIISQQILNIAFKDGALNNEARGEKTGNPHIDTDRIWWVQAETVVGFYNEYEKSGSKIFLEASEAVYDYIEKYVVDKRKGGEWFWYVDNKGIPKTDHGITEPWKCPYHNGRMCIELINRMKKNSKE